ncbi:hypothetical protein GGR53DRAFT_212530 [Hypoxylon sp. FL1150]|nr:hypothetical protein GGR53DRAFT_212530 [Hypoxylon sp. FL1150]
MRILALPPFLLLSIALQARASTTLQNDFSSYPQGSQQCLSDAADQSKCSGSTGQELNECLCTNQGNFIYDSAQCVAKSSPSDLDAVYDTMENNCAGTGVTIAVSKDAFMSQASAATATTSSATPSATATSKPNDDDNDNDNDNDDNDSSGGGMATGIKVGLGVGVGFGAIALGLLAWFVWSYSRRRRNQRHAQQFDFTFPPSPSPYPPSARDVELSHNHSVNKPPWSPAASQYTGIVNAGAGAEYAQHNAQFERAELDPGSARVMGGMGLGVGRQDRDWKELPAGYYSGSEDGGGMKHGRDDKRASSVPLLAELGADEMTQQHQQQPVELPADMQYNDHEDSSRRASPALHYSHSHSYELVGEGRRKGDDRGDGGAG